MFIRQLGCTAAEAPGWPLPSVIRRFPGHLSSPLTEKWTLDFRETPAGSGFRLHDKRIAVMQCDQMLQSNYRLPAIYLQRVADLLASQQHQCAGARK